LLDLEYVQRSGPGARTGERARMQYVGRVCTGKDMRGELSGNMSRSVYRHYREYVELAEYVLYTEQTVERYVISALPVVGPGERARTQYVGGKSTLQT
jgi:hypothetical protein